MILVVGGAGYIGSHMVKRLRQLGEPHLVFDNFDLGHRAAISGAPHLKGDLRKPEDIARAFKDHRIEIVMHFAALISVPRSVTDPGGFWINNLVGVKNLLDAMHDAGVDKLVFSSTAAVYGQPKYNPVDEDHPKNPVNAYGDTKLAAEALIASYGRAYGLKCATLRYFNAAGADPEGELGADHKPEEALIPVAIMAVLGQRPPLQVFGTDYPTPDGTAIRDYVHVWDLVFAHMRAVEHLRARGESCTYNVGTERGYSVLQVVRELEALSGKPVPVNYAPRRQGDAAEVVARSAKIREDWGWSPVYPELRSMIEHQLEWRLGHPHGFA